MRIAKALFLFYRKLIVPVAVLSVVVGLIGYAVIGEFYLGTVGAAFVVLSALFHYFIYEVRNPNEYYFYYNLGLSKLRLWIFSVSFSLIVGLAIS